MQPPISLAKTIPEPAKAPPVVPPPRSAFPWVGCAYAFALGACLVGAFGVVSSGPWTPPWDAPSTFVPPDRAKPPQAERRPDPAVSHNPSRSLDRQAIEREIQSLTPERRAAVEAAMVAGERNEGATRADTPPPGSERLDGDMALGVNGWGDRLDEGRSVDGLTIAPALALPSLQDEPPIVDTSVPSSAAKIREDMVRMLEDVYAETKIGDGVAPDGLVDAWISANPLAVPLSQGAPDVWSPRRSFGVDATTAPPTFVFDNGMVWVEEPPGVWDMEGPVACALDGPLLWAVHDRGRPGYGVVQMALVDGRLRLIVIDIENGGAQARNAPVQEVEVAGWSPFFDEGRTITQVFWVTSGGAWLVRLVAPDSGATAFVRLDPEGATPPVATGVLFQEFPEMDTPTLSLSWEAPEEAWQHLPEMLSATWNAPAQWPLEFGYLLDEENEGPDAFLEGRMALSSGTPFVSAWALSPGVLANDQGRRPPSTDQTGSVEPLFDPEVLQGRVPAISGLPGGGAVVMWVPSGPDEPYAWVVGVEDAHVLEGKPFPALRRVAFTLPDAALGEILRVDKAHVWPDGAALLRVEMAAGGWVDLLWHMPSGAVVRLGG